MAEEIRAKPTSTTTNTADSSTAPKKFPKGVVLGKDGKPCRTCNSVAFWASQSKNTLSKNASFSTASGLSTATSSSPTTTTPVPANDCPPDVEALGRSSWTLLHSISATYPITPSQTEQTNLKTFMSLFATLYPCWVCAEDFQSYMEKERIRTGSRDEFGKWLCEAHNDVNEKLGKEKFDCSRWQERWRDGWKDGRCD